MKKGWGGGCVGFGISGEIHYGVGQGGFGQLAVTDSNFKAERLGVANAVDGSWLV